MSAPAPVPKVSAMVETVSSVSMTATRRRAWGAETVALATALVGAAALCRVVGGGLTGPAAGPVFGAAAAGCVAPAALLRRRASPALAVAVGAVVVALVSTWATLPGATKLGVPTATTLRVVRTDLRAARGVLSGFALPLHPGPGVILLAALLAGIAAVLGRTAYGSPRLEAGRGAPALALVPPAGLVVWSCVALPTRSAVALAAALVATGVLTVAGARPVGEATPGARPPHRAGVLLLPACGLAATVVIGLSFGIAGAAPAGSAGSSGSGREATVAATSLSLASDVVGLERHDPTVVLFRARTPFPTYWQEGTLTDWDGSGWQPDAATNDALDGRSGPAALSSLPSPSGRSFAVSVTMAALSTRLLPVPPATTRVSAPGGAAITSVGATATRPSVRDERYSAMATVPGAVGASTPTGTFALSSTPLAPYLALPAVSPVVTSTARQVTAVATTPLGRAEALVDWFRSGVFRYTLTPPPAPPGSDPLVAFLATTRAGTCESFASAYAVMARSLGLPTRIAVGFTAGRVTSGVTTVRGADAHEWPEVYLGPNTGWVSFEPTPQLPSGELTPPGVVGPTGITLPPSSTPTTPHTSVPPTTLATRPVPTSAATTPSPSATSAPSPQPGGHARSAWWLALAAVVIVVVAGAGMVWVRGRRRRPAPAPRTRVRRAYERAERDLARAGMARPPGRALTAHADAWGAILERAPSPATARHLAARDQLATAVRDLRTVAGALEDVFYADRDPGPGVALEAEAAQRRVTRVLRHRAVRAVAARTAADARAPASR